MIIDFRNLENNSVIEADLCIIGAGPAGITVAREFLNSKLQVVVIESGGFELEQDTQSLYRGENVGLEYYPLETCRLHFFGGTTGHWNGQCSPPRLSDWLQSNGFEAAKRLGGGHHQMGTTRMSDDPKALSIEIVGYTATLIYTLLAVRFFLHPVILCQL
jgi:hypothetical protein